MMWHQRLGHIREKGLRLLHDKGMVEGMSNYPLDFDLCEHCVYGKKKRVRFPSGATRTVGILQLVHSDVFGPVSVPSLGKYVYYVSFIDDLSRNTWILKSLTGLTSLSLLLRIKKVTAKPDTKLVYETPLFMRQGTPLRPTIFN
jgi:hypothetical protein